MKKKKIFALGLSLISLFSFAFTGCNVESVLPGKNNDVIIEKPIANVINSIKCSFSPTVTTYSVGEQTYIAKTITASVLPENATNKELDYSVSWRAGSERINEDVHDYVDVVQDSDGSLSATVYCYKPFGDDKILITATARDGGAKGLCTVTYVGIASEMDVTSSLTLSHNEERGDYYELATNQTYDFNVELSNIFGATSTSDLTYDVKGYGVFNLVDKDYQLDLSSYSADKLSKYFNVSFNENKLVLSTNNFGFDGGSYVDTYNSNLTNSSGSYVEIGWETNSQILQPYDYSIIEEFVNRVGPTVVKPKMTGMLNSEPVLDSFGNQCYQFVDMFSYFQYADELGAQMIESSLEFEYNFRSFLRYYFEITVTDNVSGMSKSFRFTIRPAVSSVDIPDIVV